MSIQQFIERTLTEGLQPEHLEVINESHGHSVPKNSETHFKVIAVAEAFEGKSRVARQRAVNKMLQAAFDQGLHALSLQLHTPEQWKQSGGAVAASPACAGGSKK